MGIKNYVSKGLVSLILAGSLFLSGCGGAVVSAMPTIPTVPRMLARPTKLEKRISQEATIPNNQRDKYAVLISGSIERRDMYDLSTAYQVFLENGFKKENIYILDEDGSKTPMYPVDDLSSKEAVAMLFTHLSEKTDDKDLLFVYITDHGKRITHRPANDERVEEISTIVLPGEDLNEIELKSLLDKIKSKEIIVLADICYGGGFANRFSSGKYIGISSSTEEEMAHGNVKDSFGRYLMEAYRNIPEVDKNKDGIVNIPEAFEYAKQKHPWTRDGSDTPFLKSDKNLETLTLQ